MHPDFQPAAVELVPGLPEILPLDEALLPGIRARILNKTKPPGSLGYLEDLAEQIALLQGSPELLQLRAPIMLVFAADHGIARNAVSIAPQAVTRQMVLNFLSGGAAINCLCQSSAMRFRVVDAGILEPVRVNSEYLRVQRIAPGTEDFSRAPAMSADQCRAALMAGVRIANDEIDAGAGVLGFGEMGIGNTSSASALLALVAGLPVDDVVGRGTGITDQQYRLKLDLITQGVQRVRGASMDPVSAMTALTEVGGFEVAQITGAMLGAAARNRVILVDGFIVSVAALLAVCINPQARSRMVFAHRSAERAHVMVLELMQARALLDLDLRLGEGTGAALALPLLRAACIFYNEMATFDSAGVTGVEV
ncbi:nicotinate-nucleotide--dimethylbenzimidazole phosphoribosyltransferase [Parathalassolituus penaei]|uniref:Nicotinate-nucleotide--dimethylbenzimidazole phosphoribosyltransferase n=1 Tax=Parathalassolituus penaei TaxID=2997323 RepID=A0A9X3EFU6_9GAMM|nr:nicotinate-nucleotide--dimethylbenzimidazole phosphoribosyltransferase [Parathalassolituus penaei]MCY0966734.1 nicotinate-nucleotide--dimethylbenzimidazole phosphoribosyltransferase [Parathalassolituus penaei]